MSRIIELLSLQIATFASAFGLLHGFLYFLRGDVFRPSNVINVTGAYWTFNGKVKNHIFLAISDKDTNEIKGVPMENWHPSQASHFDFRPCEWVVQCPKIIRTTVYYYFSVSPIQTQRLALYWLIKLCCLSSFLKYQYISCCPWSKVWMILSAFLPRSIYLLVWFFDN